MSQWRRVEPLLAVFYGLASFLIIFLLVPLASLFLGVDPSIASRIFGSRMMAEEVKDALLVTLAASIAAVVLLAATGIPLAYVLARYEFRGKRIIESLIDIPLVMPHAVAGIMILSAYSRRGLLGGLVAATGARIQDSFTGIVLAMAFVSAPLLVDTVKAGIASIDPMLEAVARTLGASASKAIIDIVLPLSLRHIAAGLILAWARSLSEVGAILVVAYYPMTINILIIEYMHIYGLAYAVALSALYALLAISLFTALRVVIGR
ncbi:MAG: ABC transporter permease [Pyrodictiaceae archaeon]